MRMAIQNGPSCVSLPDRGLMLVTKKADRHCQLSQATRASPLAYPHRPGPGKREIIVKAANENLGQASQCREGEGPKPVEHRKDTTMKIATMRTKTRLAVLSLALSLAGYSLPAFSQDTGQPDK